MRRPSQHTFAQQPQMNMPRSSFDRGRAYRSTFDGGFLIPFFMDDALPGDTFTVNATIQLRLGTPLEPIMDNMIAETQYFAVPYRILYDDWEKLNGAQDDPGDPAGEGAFLVPEMISAGGPARWGQLSAYLGVPLAVNLRHSAMWHRAYNKIWNQFYRAQDLQNSITENQGAGPDAEGDYQVMRRGKRHDYFSSCQPWPQKGDAVELAFGGIIPVDSAGDGIPQFNMNVTDDYRLGTGTSAIVPTQWNKASPAGGPWDATWDDPKLEVDLAAGTSVTINAIRNSVRIQALLERDSRGGTRYPELLQSHFQVTNPDHRMQRPEYLGGGSQPINIIPVPATSQNAGANIGDLGGYGVSVGSGHSFTKSFTEHCIIIGIISVRAILSYQQGLDRMMSRRSRYDFYWPSFANLGEQSVLRKEIFAVGSDHADDELVFGYNERWSEYRYSRTLNTGQFNSDAGTSLDLWHLAEDYSVAPTLGNTWIQSTPPIDRIVAVPSEPHFLMDSYISCNCARPIPTYSTPGVGIRL